MQISEENFSKRDDNFRAYKKKMLVKNPNFGVAKNKVQADHQEDEAKEIQPEQRCELLVGAARGEVKYVGKVPGLAPGYWVGVKLDEPMGDSDGKVKDKVYFECNDKFGQFCRPKDV